MASNDIPEPDPATNAESAVELAKLGITRKSVDYFYVGKYRYTDLKDAIAQAKRANPT